MSLTDLKPWVNWMQTETTLAPRTIAFYRENCQAVLSIMTTAGLPSDPAAIDTAAIHSLLGVMDQRDLAASTRNDYLRSLKKWLEFSGNDTFAHVQYALPQDTRPNVDWLTDSQVDRLLYWLDNHGTPIERATTHLMLTMGLRRIEVIRLRVSDINWQGEFLDVRGKGRGGTKLRRVPFSPRAAEILKIWLECRRGKIYNARRNAELSGEDPDALQIPEEVFVWFKGSKVSAYDQDGWGLDKMTVRRISKAVGFPIRNHTLRRTFGRTLWRGGVQIEIIAQILGHESTEQTMKYLGVSLDDMRGAMSRDFFTVTQGCNGAKTQQKVTE